MEYTYITTEAEDKALGSGAKRQGKTAGELFHIIVSADLGTLVRNEEGHAKEELKAVYDKIKDKDKEDIDKILDKYKPKKEEPVP
uniref:Uncharacterized protein n=1 Tax=viral metagenome TaxID=1070528 RepID=A0A6M3INF6_9ZZZZ